MSNGDGQARVAILLATFNGEAHLPAQLASILWQQDVDVHIFARDDGSTDGTTLLLERFAADHPRMLTLVADTAGATGSASANFFRILSEIDLGSFDFVAFADQDDVWLPDKIARGVKAMGAIGADGYSSDLIAYDMQGNRSWVLRKAGRPAVLDYLFQGASAGCTYVLTAKAANLVAQTMRAVTNPFCRGLSHDWTIYAICRSHGLAWLRDPEARIVYRQHGGNDYGAQPGLRSLAAKFRTARDNWYRNHILWLRNVLANDPRETEILDAVATGGLGARLWLLQRAGQFRRSTAEANLLRMALLAGLV